MRAWKITLADLIEAEQISTAPTPSARERVNTPWPDHGKHNPKLAPPGPNKINANAGATLTVFPAAPRSFGNLSMPTAGTKVEGV